MTRVSPRSVWILLLLVSVCRAADMTLSSAGEPFAPPDASKRSNAANGPLSEGDREDLLKEFKGLVAMGLHPDLYEQWGGRSMADCFPSEKRSERWSYRCEVITAQCNGFYYFYPTDNRQAATLQEVEVKVHSSESQLVNDMKASLRGLFGRENVLEPGTTRLPARGPVRHWKTDNDVADLFIDVSENPAGMVRFVWKRGPLATAEHAQSMSGEYARAH